MKTLLHQLLMLKMEQIVLVELVHHLTIGHQLLQEEELLRSRGESYL